MKPKYATYFAIEKQMRQLGDTRSRHEIISDFTSGIKSSLAELSPTEYKELITQMTSIVSNTADCNTMRRKIIATLVKCGYRKSHRTLTDVVEADMDRIYAWVLKYGYLHKPLNQYTIREIPTLVTQAEKLYTSHLEA
jgi:hypothetical protein